MLYRMRDMRDVGYMSPDQFELEVALNTVA